MIVLVLFGRWTMVHMQWISAKWITRTIEFFQITWLISYELRWTLLLFLVLIEYLDMIKDHNESLLDLDGTANILISFEYQLNDDSVIVVVILYIPLLCDMRLVWGYVYYERYELR